MKHLNRRRLLSLALALVMVIGLLPAGLASAEESGVTAMNEAYEARESLAPVGTAFTIESLLDWTPETDPDAAYSRASVSLQDRQGGFTVNSLANPEAKLMLCAMNDSPTAQGSESFFSYAFNYWQYTDTFIYWGGNGEGFIQAPTGELIDAAHTNGVPIVGVLGFPWGYGTGYVEQVDAFCQKAADGTFPVADKLIEVMDYYGFDGWFFNQESYGCNAEIANRLNEMMRYMHELRPDILISWYDSMIYTGSVSYQDAVNSYNQLWMEADENGNWGVDEFFMNYNWYSSDVSETISTMKSIGRSQYDAFAGFNVQSNVYGDTLRDYLLVDEDGLAKLSLALYYANQTQTMASDGEEFHKTEQAYYVNAAGDPRVNNVDVSDSTVTEWAGMSRFFADKTPVTEAPFVTDFNTGHGKAWFVDGEKLRDTEWSYQSNQDVLPTYTWIIDSNGTQKVEGSYDFDDAYNGGSSIKFSGTTDASNIIKLYSTNVEITDGMTLSMTAKGGLENAALVAYLGDDATDSYDACEQVVIALESGEGWVETSADLSEYAGKTLCGIGLEIVGEQEDFQINLGRLTILEKTRAALNGPNTVKLDDILYADPYTAEARIQWSKVTGASSYEIYKLGADGSKTFLMETPNTAYYIPTLTRDADETDVTLEIVPVNRNGVRGTGTELVIDWLYGNDDGERYEAAESVNVCLGATVTGYSEQGDGAECDKALDGISGNSSKWWASGVGDWFSIDLGEEKTVVRLRMEHAESGGEGKELNTSAYTVYYKDASGNWVEAYKLTGNTDAVNDVLLETPVTAREWKLVINGIGPSPWSAVNIYEWQMFETGFPDTEPVPMHFASAFNGEGAADTFTLTNLPASRTVKVYDAEGALLGEAEGSGTVTIENLDFGTADAGRVYYTTTETGYGESVKFSAPFEAEAAEKSEPATDVEYVQFSQPGSVSSSHGSDIYVTMTVSGLSEGDVVYVYEDGPDAAATRVSVPVAAGETSVSMDRVRVPRAWGDVYLQVKRVGYLISDVYTVDGPLMYEPTASIRVYAVNEAGETLTGVRFDVLVNGTEECVSQLSTTSDSGASCGLTLGEYIIRNTESPEGYSLAEDIAIDMRIEGWTTTYTVVIPAESEEPDPTDPPEVDPSDDSRDIPLDVLNVSCGDYEPDGGASEGPAELAVDNDPNTLWHTDWEGTSRENHWFQFELTEDYNVDGLRYLPRSNGSANGTITEYDIQVSDDGVTFTSVGTGNWEANSEWKYAAFPASHVKYVRLVSVNAVTDNSWVFASAAEIRLTGEVYVDLTPPEMEPDDDSRDIPVEVLTATAGDWQTGYESTEGPAELVLDGNINTIWHTDWYGTSRANHWIQFELSEDYGVDGLRYLPRSNGSTNGTITEYDVQVSDDGVTFRSVVSGNWENNTSWKLAQFDREEVRYVRLVAVDAVTDNAYVFASAAEIRLTGVRTAVSDADKSALDALIQVCGTYVQGDYTDESWANFQAALEHARAVSADPTATQEEVDAAREALMQAMMALEVGDTYAVIIAALEHGTITADPTRASEGQIVTLTVIPDEGWSLVPGSLKVNGEPIEGRTFVMPAEDVTVTAEFENAYEQALEAAKEAQEAAEAAKAAAEEAQRKAEEAAAAAEEAAASAAEDKEAAAAARQEAEEAQAAAEAAQKAAEDAQKAAETAQTAAEAHDAAAAEAAAAAAESAREVAELYEQIAAMKAEMAEYLKDAQKAAEEAEEHNKAAAAAELACLKYEALIELALYADPDDYDAVNAALVKAAIDAGIEAINAAENAEEIAQALKEAKLAIDLIGIELPFADVPANAFYEDPVKWALAAGITTGTSEGEFSPEKTVTRAEAVTFLWRAAGKPAATVENPFADVSESDFYYEAVLWAVENGITTGVDADHFGPLVTANRAQIVTFLHRAKGSPAVEAENPFADVAETDWFYAPVLWAVENGITTGLMPTIFGPNGQCNRAQMVTFLYRAYA